MNKNAPSVLFSVEKEGVFEYQTEEDKMLGEKGDAALKEFDLLNDCDLGKGVVSC